jgi:Flp pilus assembly pilin Flp
VWRDERGQALVEFALVAVFFVGLLSGLVDLGRVAATYVVMASAAREGARAAALGQSDVEVVARVEQASTTLDTGRLEITVQPPYASRSRGMALEVRLAYRVDLLMPFTAALLPNPLPLQVATVMRME